MTADLVNLNKARKARVAAAAEREAARNRLRHGRTKTERQQAEAELVLAESRLENLRVTARDPDEA